MNRILAINPIYRGFGFAVIEDDPLQLIYWGVAVCDRRKTAQCLKRVQKKIDEYQPAIIVTEDCSGNTSPRFRKNSRLIQGIAVLAKKTGIRVELFSEAEIKQCFSRYGAGTKHQMAEVMVQAFREFMTKLPEPRLFYESQNYQMYLFNALALGFVFLAKKERSPHEHL